VCPGSSPQSLGQCAIHMAPRAQSFRRSHLGDGISARWPRHMILFMRSIRKIALRRGCMCVVVPLLVVCEWRADTHVQRRALNVTCTETHKKIPFMCVVFNPGTAGRGTPLMINFTRLKMKRGYHKKACANGAGTRQRTSLNSQGRAFDSSRKCASPQALNPSTVLAAHAIPRWRG
jgi:hypothetical protein